MLACYLAFINYYYSTVSDKCQVGKPPFYYEDVLEACGVPTIYAFIYLEF